MLFNTRQESYVSGKGSILTNSLPDAVREEIVAEGACILGSIQLRYVYVLVGARKRETSHGIQKAPPLSGDCFWQLEKSANPLSGIVLLDKV